MVVGVACVEIGNCAELLAVVAEAWGLGVGNGAPFDFVLSRFVQKAPVPGSPTVV